MSMKKFTKKMLAIVAAGAMTMGLAMPAMAAEGTTADTVNNAKEAYISKTYNTEVGKAETFSFTATQITDGDDVIHTAHAVTIPTISFGTTCSASSMRLRQRAAWWNTPSSAVSAR